MKRSCSLMSIVAIAVFTPTAWGALIAYEGMDYPVASPGLDGKTGGFGWTTAWTSVVSPLSIAPDGASLDSPAYPFSPVGNRAYSPTASQGIAVRGFTGFDAAQDGNVFFASFLLQKVSATATTTAANVEVDFGPSSSAQAIRVGFTSGNGLLLAGTGLGNQSTPAGSLNLGDTYFTVVKVTASSATPDLVQAIVFGPGDSLPSSEPATWTIQRNDYNLSSLDTVRLWIGANAEGAIDEIRLGSTWQSVTVVPEPASIGLAVLGAVAFWGMRRRGR